MITTTFSQHPCLQKHFDHSWQANNSLRQAMQYALAPLVRQAPVSVVVVGSYGRCEVSRISDIDFFIVHDGSMSEARLLDVLHQVKNLVRPLSWPGESDESKFGQGALSLYSELSNHIGWKQESNTALTRRMLLLLEGRPLFGDESFTRWRTELLCRYVASDQGTGLPRFMLNDVVRYYRSMMANCEEKRAEGKAWGVRNIKLKFSRKLLYLGGIVVIAEAHGLPASEKIKRLDHWLSFTPLQRVAMLGQSNPHTGQLLEQYALFLDLISSLENRRRLDSLSPEYARTDPLYREISIVGKAFSEGLEQWLAAQYPGHPILHAMLF